MNLKSIVKTIVRAAPAILAHAPAIVAAMREVKRATRRTSPPPG